MGSTNDRQWTVVFAMPNLESTESFDGPGIAIVPANDIRVTTAAAAWSSIRKLMDGFVDLGGRKIQPAALVAEQRLVKALEADAFVAFRNCLSLSVVVRAWAWIRPDKFRRNLVYSDYFDFWPTVPANEQDLISSSPAATHYGSAEYPFHGIRSPYVEANLISPTPDRVLLKALIQAWECRFLNGSSNDRLFRSLQVAYKAASMPVLHWHSFYEWGTHLALWISALEILAHPEQGDVSQASVWDLLDQYQWGCTDLQEPKYSLKWKGNTRELSFLQFLYSAVYKARNDFLHGNPITEDKLQTSLPDGRVMELVKIAPLIYRTGLAAFLGLKAPVTDTLTADGFSWYTIQAEYEECLLRSDQRHL